MKRALLGLALIGCGGPVGTGDGIVDADEVPGLGWTAEIVGTSHDFAGTAVVVDETTIEIRDMVFDGGGINARLFLLPDGAAFNREFELTENLVGTEFTGETLEVTYPEGSFEEWNLITLWCLPAAVSFGEGVFLPPDDIAAE